MVPAKEKVQTLQVGRALPEERVQPLPQEQHQKKQLRAQPLPLPQEHHQKKPLPQEHHQTLQVGHAMDQQHHQKKQLRAYEAVTGLGLDVTEDEKLRCEVVGVRHCVFF